MSNPIYLSDIEQSIIKNALNESIIEAQKRIENKGFMMDCGRKKPLSKFELNQLKERVKLACPLYQKIRNL